MKPSNSSSEWNRVGLGQIPEVVHAKGVLHGKVLTIDATTLEANAAMKSSGCEVCVCPIW
jgi:hypothetical protein